MTEDRVYPSALAYVRAVQHPAAVFRTATLQQATFLVNPKRRVPWPASGQFAVVFRAQVEGSPRALRFYTSPMGDGVRYAKLTAHFERGPLSEHLVASTWSDEAIRVNEDWWPMVSMPWVDGAPLDAHVTKLVADGDSRGLRRLAIQWRQLIVLMQVNGFAHGDLQHGNVLVEGISNEARLRLVDFDGAWVAELGGMPAPREGGHPNYRIAGTPWGATMDTFPGLAVYTALIGIAHAPGSWDGAAFKDKILFDEGDFQAGAATPVWRRLEAIGDPALQHALRELRACCVDGSRAARPLQEILPFWQVVKVDDPIVVTGPIPRPPPRTVPIPPPVTAVPTGEPDSPTPPQPVPPVRLRRSAGVYAAAMVLGLLVGYAGAVLVGIFFGVGVGLVTAITLFFLAAP